MNSQLRPFLAAGLLLALMSCRDAPTKPSGETATFSAQLFGSNEVPPVANIESSGSASVTIAFEITRDSAGAITMVTAAFQMSFLGYPPGTTVTMAHIHRGSVNVNGPIVVDTGLTLGEVVLTTGSGGFAKSGIAVPPALAQEIMSTPVAFYFNVHSMLNPDGMARGQLVRQ
jgi:hypothetical protein